MIDTGAGVIDADYRGVVSVLLFTYRTVISKVSRTSKTHVNRLLITIVVKEGDRIAQLIIEKIHTLDVLEVQVSIPLLLLV